MKTNSDLLAKSIFFASLLISGAVLFFAVAAFNVDWFGPSMVFLVAAVLGWDRFMNGHLNDAQSRNIPEEDDLASLERRVAGSPTATNQRSFVGEKVVYTEVRPTRSTELE